MAQRAEEQTLFPYKLVVGSLGLLLLGGMAVLMAALWERAGTPECKGGTVYLGGQGEIAGVYTEGKEVRIWLKKQKDEQAIVTVDLCTGKEKSTLVLTQQKP